MNHAIVELSGHFIVALLFGALNRNLPGRTCVVEVGLAERVEYGFNEGRVGILACEL